MAFLLLVEEFVERLSGLFFVISLSRGHVEFVSVALVVLAVPFEVAV